MTLEEENKKRYGFGVGDFVIARKESNFSFSDIHGNCIKDDKIRKKLLANPYKVSHLYSDDVVIVLVDIKALTREEFIYDYKYLFHYNDLKKISEKVTNWKKRLGK